MKMIVEANTAEEIGLLSRAVSMALGCSSCPTASIAQPTENVVAENPENVENTVSTTATVTEPTEKPTTRRRGRPKNEPAVAETPVANNPAPEVSAVTESADAPPCTYEELRELLVQKADSNDEMKEKIVNLIQKFTTDGSLKTANIPVGSYKTILDEVAKLAPDNQVT